MFLHEHGLEVSVDIPLPSKSVGFGTKASGMEVDDEVELAEEFGPLDLAAGEQFMENTQDFYDLLSC